MSILSVVDLDHLPEIISGRFLYHKVTPFSLFPFCALWKAIARSNPHLSMGGLCSISPGVKYLHKLFRVFCMGDLSIFMYLFIHCSIIYLYYCGCYILSSYTLDYSPTLLHFSAQIVQALTIGGFQLALVSLWYAPIVIFLNKSLHSGIVWYCRLILYISHWGPGISNFSKEAWFLLVENGTGNQGLDSSLACCYWGITRPSQLTARKYMYPSHLLNDDMVTCTSTEPVPMPRRSNLMTDFIQSRPTLRQVIWNSWLKNSGLRGGMISLKTGKMLLRKGELGAQGQEQMTLVLGGNPYQRPERNTKSLEPLFFGESTGQSVTRENDEFFERLFP